jgi:prevent-host-death family protein
MSQIAIEEQIADLRDLVARVKSGDEIVITEAAIPVARLSPISSPKPGKRIRKRKFGTLRKHLIYMADDFDAPLEDFAEYM